MKGATAIIQARMNSRRFPGKVVAKLDKTPVIAYLIERVKLSKEVDQIILATTVRKEDDLLEEIAKQLKIQVYRGSIDDVLKRYSDCLKLTKNKNIIRITGDCPFVDAKMIDNLVQEFNMSGVDYLSNCEKESYPDGLDIEIFTRDILIRAQEECTDLSQREHVTPWIRQHAKLKKLVKCEEDLSWMRWTIDEEEDLIIAKNIAGYFKGNMDFTWRDIVEFQKGHKEMFNANKNIKRNQGTELNEGQKLWKRAKKVIPGGNMLLSKRSEMYLPGKWPAYYKRAKGCQIWDLEDKKLVDMCVMGVGTNILGYANNEIDEEVISAVKSGNMSTLNCADEVELGEKLVDMHRWSKMVRFARSGGEANAIAIRIARAATGNEVVAVCGYHGWHDWYLATNIESTTGLNEHLLPGLEANGVPKGLTGTVIPFSYNKIEEIEEISKNYKLAAIKMEVQRSEKPKKGYLERIRQICDKKGIVLIFDECTSGFRETLGGLHLKYEIYPDMMMLGKALGNGYAITAVVGKEAVMQAAQKTFISSTFWTEKIGTCAAIKTIEIMERTKSWELISEKGQKLKKLWEKIAKENNINIKVYGLDALAGFRFEGQNNLKYKTYITQEMLKFGYLATTSCYLSIAHTDEIVNDYIEKLNIVFARISEFQDGENVDDYLEGPVCQTGFQRLN